MLSLPESLRSEFKEPMGPVYTDAEELLADAADPIVAVGDVVTYHLRRAGRNPDVAVLDWRTEREAVDEETRDVLDDDTRRIHVENPPATLSAALIDALVAAVAADEPVVIEVDGEEDLAALLALLLVEGGSVVYGQPGEGMVLVESTPASRDRARDLLERMEGDTHAAFDRLGV
jgi:hypothetical protein